MSAHSIFLLLEKIMQEKPFIGMSMNFMKLGQFNQFHIRDTYIEAVYDNGGLPLPIPCLEEPDDIKAYLSQMKGLIIIGGMDYPPELYGLSVGLTVIYCCSKLPWN
jgi:gamma-glutamyl-gamma-aminobutyrate hydrolase PuuD